MTLSAREKTILGLCIVVAVGALFCVLALDPLLTGWQSTGKKIQRAEISLRKISKIIVEKEKLEKEFNELARRAKSGIPEKEWETALLSSLDRMARHSGVDIVRREPVRIKNHSFYRELSADVVVECNLTTLSKFLYQMETAAQIFNVESLQLDPKQTGSSQLQGQISISTIQLVASTVK